MNRYIIRISVIFLLVILPFISSVDSSNNSSNWEIQTVTELHGYGISTALDSNNRMHMSYSRGDLKYAFHDGDQWQMETVDLSQHMGYVSVQDTSIALDVNDKPHIIFSTTSRLGHAYYDGNQWQTEMIGNYSQVENNIDVALDSNNFVHASYSDSDSGLLKYSYFDGIEWHTQIADSNVFVYEDTSISLDSNDLPHICYYDRNSNRLKYVRYNGDHWRNETIEIHDLIVNPSMLLDISDNPHICYAGGDRDLKYAYYNGVEWEIETVDSQGIVGEFSSIAFDSANHIHISYSDWSNKDIKYVFNNGMKWYFENLDLDFGGRREEVSMELDSKDKPHIIFSSRENGDLGYAVKDNSDGNSANGNDEDSDSSSKIPWLWIGAGLIILIAITLIVAKRRRDEEWDEDAPTAGEAQDELMRGRQQEALARRAHRLSMTQEEHSEVARLNATLDEGDTTLAQAAPPPLDAAGAGTAVHLHTHTHANTHTDTPTNSNTLHRTPATGLSTKGSFQGFEGGREGGTHTLTPTPTPNL